MYNLPSMNNVVKVVINDSLLKGEIQQPILIFEEVNDKKKKISK